MLALFLLTPYSKMAHGFYRIAALVRDAQVRSGPLPVGGRLERQMTRLLILEGDGIGPEIVAATRAVIEAADRAHGLGLTLEAATIGLRALAAKGTTLPEAVLDRALAADGVVLGPVSHNVYPPVEQGGINPSARLRTGLDLYANIRPALTPAGVTARAPMDLVIVRENTEGFYADRNMAGGARGELMPTDDLALAVRKITRRACRRIAESAFALAATRPARHVTAVHKANVLRMSDGLFLEETRAMAARHPDIAYDEGWSTRWRRCWSATRRATTSS